MNRTPTVNHQYFLVEIDKAAQEKKRLTIQSQEKPYLGLKAYLSYHNEAPALTVLAADEGSPAEKAGFKSGDIIVSVGGAPIESFEHFVEYIFKKQPGDTLTLQLYNALSVTDRLEDKTVTLGAKASGLVRSNLFVDMQYNLQYGVIHQIGQKAREEFPMAEEGDILIFNHKVEYKDREVGDHTFQDYHLVGTTETGNELRIVDYSYEAYGVIKLRNGDHTIYPYKDTIFCHQHIQDARIQKHNGLYLPDNWRQTMEDLEDKIEELQLQVREIAQSTVLSARTTEQNHHRQEEIRKQIERINRERNEVSKKLHQRELKEITVLFINPTTCQKLGTHVEAGDKLVANYHTLYPLDIGGVYYTLAHVNYVDIHISKNNIMKALNNSVIVRPDPKKTQTEGGIIIPDTAIKPSETGTVVCAGPGTDQFPLTHLTEGTRVRYGQFAGDKFEHNGESLIRISASDIYIYGFE